MIWAETGLKVRRYICSRSSTQSTIVAITPLCSRRSFPRTLDHRLDSSLIIQFAEFFLQLVGGSGLLWSADATPCRPSPHSALPPVFFSDWGVAAESQPARGRLSFIYASSSIIIAGGGGGGDFPPTAAAAVVLASRCCSSRGRRCWFVAHRSPSVIDVLLPSERNDWASGSPRSMPDKAVGHSVRSGDHGRRAAIVDRRVGWTALVARRALGVVCGGRSSHVGSSPPINTRVRERSIIRWWYSPSSSLLSLLRLFQLLSLPPVLLRLRPLESSSLYCPTLPNRPLALGR